MANTVNENRKDSTFFCFFEKHLCGIARQIFFNHGYMIESFFCKQRYVMDFVALQIRKKLVCALFLFSISDF